MKTKKLKGQAATWALSGRQLARDEPTKACKTRKKISNANSGNHALVLAWLRALDNLPAKERATSHGRK